MMSRANASRVVSHMCSRPEFHQQLVDAGAVSLLVSNALQQVIHNTAP